MKYYKRIKDCREDNDLTQQDIADYLKVSRGAYSMYECGSNIIPLKLLDKLSLKYTVSIDYLVGLSNDKSDGNIRPMNYNKLCQNLKELRLQNNLSQEQVADILGVSQSHYASYENGHSVIPITRLMTLSKFYKVRIDYIMGKINKILEVV